MLKGDKNWLAIVDHQFLMGNTSGVVVTATLAAVAAMLIYLAHRKYGILGFLFKAKKLITLVDPDAKYALPLMRKEVVSPNTARFRFQLPSDEHVLGLPVGNHIYLSARIDGKIVVRPYTPISSDDDKGFVELMIKIYRANEHPKYPSGGKMTQYLDSLKIGDKIDFRGPSGLLFYKGHGIVDTKATKTAKAVRNFYRELGMIAGGSGITPMLQMIRDIMKDETDQTKVSLLFANISVDDILLRNELDGLAETHPSRFHVWYTVDKPPAGWKYSTGFISAEMIEKHLPGPADDVLILMCGPGPMVNNACTPSLDKLGYPNKNRFIF